MLRKIYSAESKTTEAEKVAARIQSLGGVRDTAEKTESKAEAKSEDKIQSKPEVKAAVKQEVKTAVKAEVKVEPKPEVVVEAKPEVKVEPKPAAKAEAKPAAKPVAKPPVEVPPEVKIEVKVEATPVVKPEAKAEVSPAVKVEAKKDPKQPRMTGAAAAAMRQAAYKKTIASGKPVAKQNVAPRSQTIEKVEGPASEELPVAKEAVAAADVPVAQEVTQTIKVEAKPEPKVVDSAKIEVKADANTEFESGEKISMRPKKKR